MVIKIHGSSQFKTSSLFSQYFRTTNSFVMKTIHLLLLLCISTVSEKWYAQFNIGHTTITYNDPARTGGYGSGGGPGRQIQSEIYYPATATGDNTPVSVGTFPIIVFGHGFVMTWDSYANIWEHYVQAGYILIFPRTEGGFSPDHSNFGQDLVTVGNRLSTDCSNASFILYNHWNGKSAVMGHSMGGGSTLLAGENPNANFDVLVGLAPAETNPSAIAAASNLSIPAIIFSGTEDAVTQPADHHIPIYNAIPVSNCKQFISITGGAHCYFANSSTTCDFGEGSSGGNISITRPQQHQITFDLLDPYLNFYLKSQCSEWSVFLNKMTTESGIQATNDCTYTLPSAPVITQNGTLLSIATTLQIQWYKDGVLLSGETGSTLTTTTYGNGTYSATTTDQVGCTANSNAIVMSVSGLEENKDSHFEVFPNPVQDELTIKTDKENQTVQLYTINGSLVQTIQLSNTSVNLSTRSLASGIYYLQNATGYRLKIVKQ